MTSAATQIFRDVTCPTERRSLLLQVTPPATPTNDVPHRVTSTATPREAARYTERLHLTHRMTSFAITEWRLLLHGARCTVFPTRHYQGATEPAFVPNARDVNLDPSTAMGVSLRVIQKELNLDLRLQTCGLDPAQKNRRKKKKRRRRKQQKWVRAFISTARL